MKEASVIARGEAVELYLADVAATARLANALAALAKPGDVIGLQGALGCGKTTFARAFIRALTSAAEEVPSPTFTLVQVYDGRTGRIFHFDAYRLNEASEAWELDIEDAFAQAISLVEWPERLGALMPEHSLYVTFHSIPATPNARRLRLRGGPSWSDRIDRLRKVFSESDHD